MEAFSRHRELDMTGKRTIVKRSDGGGFQAFTGLTDWERCMLWLSEFCKKGLSHYMTVPGGFSPRINAPNDYSVEPARSELRVPFVLLSLSWL